MDTVDMGVEITGTATTHTRRNRLVDMTKVDMASSSREATVSSSSLPTGSSNSQQRTANRRVDTARSSKHLHTMDTNNNSSRRNTTTNIPRLAMETPTHTRCKKSQQALAI